MTDTPSKPRKILGVNKSADTAKDDERDPFDTVRSGPRGRVALQRARELKASQPAPAPVKRAPRPAEGKAPRPSGERKPWVKREGTDAAQRGPRTEGKRPAIAHHARIGRQPVVVRSDDDVSLREREARIRERLRHTEA